ncbi:hypothetical protein KIN20_005071 [Parelaphostrongylus tenuis]|uniref:Uncharacterized protein n=1 Tax=Parelaphostrongylus tenuis TaxID=148309 RepID=A0AAD5MIA9_PARTN|nr:hypothetical protein KIN20_005071 [Parelaphostrongylus tenuis]
MDKHGLSSGLRFRVLHITQHTLILFMPVLVNFTLFRKSEKFLSVSDWIWTHVRADSEKAKTVETQAALSRAHCVQTVRQRFLHVEVDPRGTA